MALPPLTALAFCLVISTGGSQGFTVEPAQSDLYVRIGGEAEFTARPSRAIASGNWVFNSKTIVTWIGATSSILAEYRSRVNLNFTSGSLVLRSVSESDNGDYTASLTAGGGVQAAVTITLKALEPISQPVVTSNDTRPVEHNVTVTLACAAVGTDVSYAWSMNGLALSPGGRLVLSNGNRTLTISGVLRSDKEFTCTGSNPVNTNTSDPFLLDVSYGPESVNISVSPEQAAHISGSDQVSLTCSAVSKPAPEYQWLFNGLFQQSGQQLVIAALGVNDTGSYTCQVFNNVTKRSSSSTRDIAVIEPVSTPNITSNASSFIEYNDTVILACVAAGTNVSYTWLEDNSVIPNGGRLELSASNTTLTITGVLRSDGPFTCRVSNTLSAETSEPFHLNVFYGPDLPIIIPDPDTPAYISGTDVTLTCSAESKPAAVLGWYLQGDLVQSGPQLTIHNVSTKDIGSYFCQAFNNMTRRYRASSILIDVLELVENVNLRSNNCYPAEHRDSVLFTCDSRGTQLKREWLFNNQPVQQNDRITISGDTLLIDPVNRADTGMYKCIVSNGLNNGSAETYLKVFYGPEKVWILPPAPVVAIVGSNLMLTCLAISEPGGEYHWHNASSWLQSGQVYTLESVSSANSGNYTCLVINHITKRSSRLTVQITATAAAVPETRSGLTPGAIAGIVVGLIAAGLIGGVGGWLIARKTSGPRAEPGTKYDANRSPRGQTTSATDAGNGLATYENLPGNKQRITHAPAGDSTYMGLKLEDRSIYSELHRSI